MGTGPNDTSSTVNEPETGPFCHQRQTEAERKKRYSRIARRAGGPIHNPEILERCTLSTNPSIAITAKSLTLPQKTYLIVISERIWMTKTNSKTRNKQIEVAHRRKKSAIAIAQATPMPTLNVAQSNPSEGGGTGKQSKAKRRG